MTKLCCILLLALGIVLAFFSCNSGDCESSLDCEAGQACINGSCSSMSGDIDIDIDIDGDVDTDGDSDSDTGTGFDPEFISVWQTDETGVSEPNQINLPLVENGTYNFTVDWGDKNEDTITSWDDAAKLHEYSVAGTYTVTIDGQLMGWAFDDLEAKKLLEIKNWGESFGFGDTTAQFKNCENLTISAGDVPDLSQTTSLQEAFAECSSLTTVPNMGNWDTSNVTNMSMMFWNAGLFSQDLDGWDTSNVTDMSQMFYSADSFNGDISSWNTSNVTNMSRMFTEAFVFNRDLPDWDVSNVTSMELMFRRADAFNGDISTWDVSSVTDMTSMFIETTVFNQDISNWIVSNVTSTQGMFKNAYAFNQNINSWDTSNVTDMSEMFLSALVFNQPLSNWDTSSVTTMTGMFRLAPNFDQDLSEWDVTSVTDMSMMFESVSLSFANYDALLIGWESQFVQSNVTFSGGSSQYSSAAALARASLIDNYNWTITDGGQI